MAAGIGRVENGEIRPLRKGNYLFNRVLLIFWVLMCRIDYRGSGYFQVVGGGERLDNVRMY